jgi:hypothetical protein
MCRSMSWFSDLLKFPPPCLIRSLVSHQTDTDSDSKAKYRCYSCNRLGSVRLRTVGLVGLLARLWPTLLYMMLSVWLITNGHERGGLAKVEQCDVLGL